MVDDAVEKRDSSQPDCDTLEADDWRENMGGWREGSGAEDGCLDRLAKPALMTELEKPLTEPERPPCGWKRRRSSSMERLSLPLSFLSLWGFLQEKKNTRSVGAEVFEA